MTQQQFPIYISLFEKEKQIEQQKQNNNKVKRLKK